MEISIEALYACFTKSSGVCTDTRKITQKCFFWGLKGENFDGGNFCEQALIEGASFALRESDDVSNTSNIFHVKDSLKTLQNLANYHRHQFGIPILAITGSNGKTTTKELLRDVLATHYKTHATKGNFNNHIGVPLTLLEMPIDTEIAIIEMGANHQGEIAALCEIVEPTCGLITNIGKAHLEGFGGIEGVIKGKSELYHFLQSHNCLSFVNVDEPALNELSKGLSKKILYKRVGTDSGNYFMSEVDLEEEFPFLSISFNSVRYGRTMVQSHLIGLYNFNNLMTAVVVGQYFKVADESIKRALENYIPSNNRSQIIKKEDFEIILDAYNANPSSMSKAITNFIEMKAKRKILIMGEMLELGQYSVEEHQKILDLAVSGSFEWIALIGAGFSNLHNANNVLKFNNIAELKAWFDALNKHDALILLKASRGSKLEQLVSA